MIRFVVRWAFRFFVLAVVVAVALVLLKDTLAKSLLEARIRTQTGMDVKVERVELGLLSPTLTIENLKLYNAPQFGGSPFLDIPDLHAVYDPAALCLGRLHLRLLRLVLSEVHIVESQRGQTNLNVNLDLLDLPPAPKPGEREEVFGLTFAGIDTLNLSFGKITYSSLRKNSRPTEVKVGLRNQVITGIRTLTELRQVVMNAMLQHGITVYSDSPAERRASNRRSSASEGARH